jgi:hypothetical protein
MGADPQRRAVMHQPVEHIGVAARFVQNCTLRPVRNRVAFEIHSERVL